MFFAKICFDFFHMNKTMLDGINVLLFFLSVSSLFNFYIIFNLSDE